MDAHGLGTMVGIVLRTGWRSIAAWVVGLVAMMGLTASSIVALYPDAESVKGYAASLGDSMVMLNGRIAGLDTLGGVLANEFAIVAGFGVPLMAVSLTGRATRKDEEAGRVELLLAARFGRHAPLLAAVLVAIAALVVTGAGLAVTMAAVGVPGSTALLYGAGVAGLGMAFCGVTALLAQVFEHNRMVWLSAMAFALVSLLGRGWAALRDSGLVWASPHGWLDQVRAAGDDPRPWALVLPVVATVALLAMAAVLATRRDVGAAMVRGRATSPRASAALLSPLGLAWYEIRTPVVGWTVGTAVLMGAYGSMTQEIINAIRDNPAIGDIIGADASLAEAVFLPQVLSMFLLMLGMLVASFLVMAGGSLRAEEEAGRMESELSGTRARWVWLGTHLVVMAVSALLIWAAGALALGAAVASTTEDGTWLGEIVVGAVPYLAPAAVFLGLSILLLGVRPRWQLLGWVGFALAAVVAYLGPGFDLPGWLVDASLFPAVGDNVLSDGASVPGVVAVSIVAVVLLATGCVGFTRRDIPAG